MAARLGIVVVNYRTADLVIGCMRSLSDEPRRLPHPRVVVVDNASGDGSADRIAAAIREERWGSWVSLLPLADNRGFSAGNNAGLRLLLQPPEPADHVLLLNPDTVVRAGALRALLDFADGHPKAGIVGSRLEGPEGTPQNSAFRFHSVVAELDRGLRSGVTSRLLSRWGVVLPQPESACRADWVSGASMLIRREVLESIGPFDEGYFLYYEEVDFCLCWPISLGSPDTCSGSFARASRAARGAPQRCCCAISCATACSSRASHFEPLPPSVVTDALALGRGFASNSAMAACLGVSCSRTSVNPHDPNLLQGLARL